MQRISNPAALIVLLAFGLTQQHAVAQQPPPTPIPPETATSPAPAAPAAPEQAPGAPAQPSPPTEPGPPQYVSPTYEQYTATEGREFIGYPSGYDDPMRPHNEAEFIIGVPIWFTSDEGIVDPGVSFEARFARRFGFIAPEFIIGWQINWLDEEQLPTSYQYSNITIDTFYFALGARVYPVPKATKITPFFSGEVDFNFWHITGDEDLVCGWYYCSTVANYEFGMGLAGRLGLAIRATPTVQLDVGAKIGMAFPMGPIDDTEAWVTPFLGFNAVM